VREVFDDGGGGEGMLAELVAVATPGRC